VEQKGVVVGNAHAFISHAWAQPWGQLVAAAAHCSREGRRVWVDVLSGE
jgi:hypothetical protein